MKDTSSRPQSPFHSRFHQAAHLYAKRFGFAVIPVSPKGKHPIIEKWPEKATKDERLINSWWEQWPEANIGCVTGCASGLVVVDIDHRPGMSASEVLFELESEFGAFPETPHVLSGGGGLHFYFRLQKPQPKIGQFRPQVDIQADGAQIILPPSVHSSGRRYQWEASSHIREIPIAPLPEKLAAAIERQAQPLRLANQQNATIITWSEFASSGVGEGGRNDAIAKFCGHLLRKNVDAEVVRELIFSWNETHCRPPLSKTEVDRILQSIARAEIQRRVREEARDGRN